MFSIQVMGTSCGITDFVISHRIRKFGHLEREANQKKCVEEDLGNLGVINWKKVARDWKNVEFGFSRPRSFEVTVPHDDVDSML